MGGVTTTPLAFDAIKNEIIDQRYDPRSTNAQSGKAVAQAIANIDIPKSDGADVDTSLFASAIQNNVSGGVVFASDVGTLEHKVKVKLSGNVAENLLPITPVAKPMGIDYEKGDGIYLINGTIDSELPIVVFVSGGSMSLERGKTYTLDLGTTTNKVWLNLALTNSTYNQYEEFQTNEMGKVSVTVGENNVIQALTLMGEQGTVIDNLLVRPALYENTTSTDYTQVKLYRYGINSSVDKVEYTPNADGIVEVDSLSPYMSLVTDKYGLTIDATYNIDTKTYVDRNKGSGGGVGGENGATFTPRVSAEGVISWTNDKGLANPTPVNIKGKDGEDGYTPQKDKDYFDGEDGQRGNGILKVTTTPSSYTTATGGKNPIKRMSISTIKTQAKVDEVLIGDQIYHSNYLYNVYYLDSTYAYMDTSLNMKGATGAKGDAYTLTESDKTTIAEQAIDMINAPFGAVDSIEQMTDTSKAYVLSADGNIYTYINKTVTINHEAENKFIPSEATINKSMGVSELEAKDGFVWSNAIPVDLSKETPFRIKVEGTKITEDTSQQQKLWLCSDSAGTVKTSAAMIVCGTTANLHTTLLSDGTIYADYSGGSRLSESVINQIQSVRIGFKFSNSAITSVDELSNVKITILSDAYTKTITVSEWVSTGIKPSTNGGGVNYTDLLGKINEIGNRVTTIETILGIG